MNQRSFRTPGKPAHEATKVPSISAGKPATDPPQANAAGPCGGVEAITHHQPRR